MIPTRSGVSICSLVFALLASSLTAQERYVESVQVTVVEVPVTVADKAGNPIRGLTRESFEVLDDGKRVAIDYFEVIDLATAAVKRPEAKLPAAAYRNFLLLFDLANSAPPGIARARAAALDFVKAQITPIDVVAVATYSGRDGLRLLTNFTRDRNLLAQAISSLGVSTDFRVPDTLMITSILDPSRMQPDFMDALTEETGSGSPDDGGGPGSGRGVGRDVKLGGNVEAWERSQDFNRMTQRSYEKEQIDRIRTQLESFGNVALALDRLRGQKQVILLSEGFPAHLLTGKERLGFEATRKENLAAETGELWKVDTEKRFGSVSGVQEITEMAQLFRRADVRMHAIDIRGLRTDSDVTAGGPDAAEGLRALSNEGLALVARPTGGWVFKNSNDLGERFRNLLRQQEVIYLLGIHSPAKSPGRFHELKVRTDVRGAQVTHRAGFFEASAAANPLERTLGVAEVLVKDIVVDDIVLSLSASPFPGKDGVARVPVVVEIEGARLLEKLEGERGTVDLFVYAFDGEGQARDFMQQRIELDVAQTAATLRKSGIRFFGSLRLRPGDYSIRSLARVDETSRIGSARIAVNVPAFDAGAVLRPLPLDRSTGWITILSAERGAEAAEAVSVGTTPLVPTVRMAVGAHGEQPIALMLYRIPVENLAVTTSVMGADGAPRAAGLTLLGRTATDEQEVTKLVFNFRPEGLEKGMYDLRMTVTPSGGKPTVVTLPFDVR